MRLPLLAALAALTRLIAPSLAEAGPGLVVGAVEDDVRASTIVEAEARMTEFRLSGFRAVRVTSFWKPGSHARATTSCGSSATSATQGCVTACASTSR